MRDREEDKQGEAEWDLAVLYMIRFIYVSLCLPSTLIK